MRRDAGAQAAPARIGGNADGTQFGQAGQAETFAAHRQQPAALAKTPATLAKTPAALSKTNVAAEQVGGRTELTRLGDFGEFQHGVRVIGTEYGEVAERRVVRWCDRIGDHLND